jgi:alpha-glucosidase
VKAAAIVVAMLIVLAGPAKAGHHRGVGAQPASVASGFSRTLDLTAIDRSRIVSAADRYLTRPPQTIMAFPAPRSAGGAHDFFSEGDYWWPDPSRPDGPYVRRDGVSNPGNFTAHRSAMIRLSVEVPALTAAWIITRDARYARHARSHLHAWFVDAATRMNPNLEYAQAIHGIATGRGTGIIDTIHLVEVARAAQLLHRQQALSDTDFRAIAAWFTDYTRWMTTHAYGIEEREAKNNHGTCWVAQVAAFASLTGNREQLEMCRTRFKTVLLPTQMAADGSFPLELGRTKPYGYSLFNLDAMAAVCQILSTPADNLWTFDLPDGRGMRRALAFMAPFIRDKRQWPHPRDVQYDDEWPMRHPSLLFGGLALDRPDYVALWKTLKPDSDVDEVVRNFFIRQPILWVDAAAEPAPQEPQPPRPPVQLQSPNGLLHVVLQPDRDRLTYSISMGRDAVVEQSPLGIIVDGRDLADGVELGRVDTYQVDDRYPWLGVHNPAIRKCRGTRVGLTHTATRTAWSVEMRACDDGAAFRYIVPGDDDAKRTPDEATTFRLPAGTTVWSHDFEGHYEGLYVRRDVADVPAREWVAAPLTAKLPDGRGYASITESAVFGYAGMALRADGHRGFAARLGHEEPVSYPYFLRYTPEDMARLGVAAPIAGTITTPWRVVIAGRTLNALVNADIVHNLAPAPDPKLFPEGAEASWVRPGRAVWRYLDGGENTFEGIKQFSTLAAQLGFEYHVVEGIWRQWTDDQMRELISHAKQQHVGIWLWKDSRTLTTVDEQRAFFDKCRDLGVVGAKIDFFDHEAKEMIDRYQSILREAAARRVMVNFHGANKPAGEARTWPNELTREGVYGFEHRGGSEWARHNTTLPFTRYLAGPGDYTPLVLGDRRKETSWAHQIATAAVFTSPLLVFGGHPQSLLDNPAADLIKSLPSVWDETIVLPGSDIGELAAFARRRRDTWFVAVLNGPSARTLQIDLGFLGPGRYDALLVRDERDNPAAVRVERTMTTKRGSLAIDLRAGGGFVGRFTVSR